MFYYVFVTKIKFENCIVQQSNYKYTGVFITIEDERNKALITLELLFILFKKKKCMRPS